MARLIEAISFASAWQLAAQHLLNQPAHKDFNLVLDIQDPTHLAADDLDMLGRVDRLLREHRPERSLSTVANTIFPQAIYRRHGRPAFYARYVEAFNYAHERSAWGSYALRMMQQLDAKGQAFNPLESIVSRLASQVEGQGFVSAYELPVTLPGEALVQEVVDAYDLPTFSSELDRRRYRNGPCLSHLSFKLIDREKVSLTAVYRYHYYCERALGNLLGLSQLLKFVATESGLRPGGLTCISTYAFLDASAMGGIEEVEGVL